MHRIILSLVILSFAMAPLARGQVAVKVVRIEESRIKELIKDPNQGSMISQLTLRLRLEGKDLAGATEYGGLKISEATDDTGASLRSEQFADGDNFTPLHFGMDDNQDKKDRPTEIGVSLNCPQRKATKIAHVKGEVQIKAGGAKKVITVAKVKDMAGKTLDDPALKAAKLTVTIEKLKADVDEVSLKVIGDNNLVKKVDVVGADGKPASQGRGYSGSDNTTIHTVNLNRPLDATMSLKIELLVGQKIVKVPLEVKDVALP